MTQLSPVACCRHVSQGSHHYLSVTLVARCIEQELDHGLLVRPLLTDMYYQDCIVMCRWGMCGLLHIAIVGSCFFDETIAVYMVYVARIGLWFVYKAIAARYVLQGLCYSLSVRHLLPTCVAGYTLWFANKAIVARYVLLELHYAMSMRSLLPGMCC